MKRRLFSLFLALTLVVGMLPAPAFAQETEPTQVTEAPTEAPATEAPATEAPATEAPAAEPTPAPTEAPVPETTVAPASTEVPTEPASTEDEAVAAVQAMIDALPDVDHMSEEYIDALEEAYSAYEALSESQQAQITGVEKLEALFNWVNSQVSTLAENVKEISGEVTWNNQTITTPVKLTGETTLTLVGNNKIECDAPLDLNDYNLTIKGTGTLEVVGDGRSKEYQCNGAIFDSTYTGGTASAGTLFLESGTVKASGGTHNAISLYAVELKGGSLEAYGGVRSGLACSYLYARSGSIYATGGRYGIYAAVYRGASNPGNLPILASDERDAQKAEMDSSDIGDINDNAQKKTYYIGKVTGPMFSVKAQKGYLYEGVAAQKATFAISAKNVDTDTLKVEWATDHTGLSANLTADDKSLWVTTSSDVKQGTYNLTVTVTGTDETTVTKTVTVTVLGAPVTVTTQPKDASASCKGGDLDSWQGDDKVSVTATLATGLTDPITYQWKLEGDTELDGFNQSTISLKNLYSDKKLTPQTDKPWLSSAKVYCTLTVGSYSVNTDPVTLTVNTCDYQRVGHVDGKCLQCGEFHTSDPLLVNEDGYFAIVPDESGDPSNVGGHLVGGGTFFLTKDVIHRSLNAGNATKDNKDTILDLQGHTLESLNMGNFPYGSFTLKDGTLNQCIRSTAEGKLILDGVTFGSGCFQATNYNFLEITVKGNTVFQNAVYFNYDYKPVHLRGGTFKNGIDLRADQEALALLDDGFAYQDSDGKIVDASHAGNIDGIKIQVVAHTCKYVNGKCECGRTCDHAGKVNADGYCTVCKSLVYPYAIGEVRYTSLEEALTAANIGDTITLRGDFYQGAATVEINKNVTLELGGHTLTSDADGAPVLRVLAENVTIRNGTVKNTRTAKSSPAVTVGKLDAVGGLTVKSVTFIGSSDGNTPQQYALNIYNGHAKVENGTFTGGIYVGGSLTMTGGSATSLELGSSQGKAELSGGSFGRIGIDSQQQDYKALLVEGYAYQSGTGMVKPGDMNDSTKVEIVKCTHPDGLTAIEECPYCGKKCAHRNIDQTTGLCPDCGYQKAVSLTVDGTTTFYDTFPNAAATANGQTGALLTLLKDEVLPNGFSSSFAGGKITVDWNGHTLSSDSWSSVINLDGAELTLCDSSVTKAGGIAAQKTQAIWVHGGSLTIESGTYACRVYIPVGTAKISGGIFKNDPSSTYDYAIDTGDSRYLAELMAPGYTLALDSKGEELIDMYTSKATPEHTNVYVVPHTSHNFGESGKCACGATASAQVVAGTDSSYFDNFEQAVNKAKTLPDSTVRLLKDVTLSGDSSIYIEGGTFTIDWNGHTLSGSFWGNLLTISGPANVTLKDGSNTNTGGVRHTGYGAAVCFAVGSEGRVNIQGGTYSPNVTRSQYSYGSVQISGGVFENTEGDGQTFALYDLGDRPLSQMLAPGTAFAYEADGSDLLDAYNANKPDSYRTVYAVAHTHESFDDNGVCGCGYPCPHEDVTEKGGVYTCHTCGLTMTVMVETADGNVSYTTDLAAALNDAEDGTTVTLLGDLVLTKSAYIEDGKEVTLNLNGHNITRATWQTIQVDANTDDRSRAKLVITGSGEIRFNVKAADGGQLDMSGWTGTAAGVDLENACDFVGPTGNGHLDALNISNWRNDNKGTILLQGGTIGQLWLNSFENFQMTLGSLLKPGYAARSGSEYLPYDRAISKSDNTLNDLIIVPCPHTGLDSFGCCTYCGARGFVATVTKDGVTTGYTNFQSAVSQICDGKRGTLKLLTHVNLGNNNQYAITGTLDLNGKELTGKLVCARGSDLQIVNSSGIYSSVNELSVEYAANVTIADTAARILFRKVTVESGSLADLLPEGSAYFSTDRQTWISAAEAARMQTLENVAVATPPVQSMTLTANKTSVPYGESQTVSLSADYVLGTGYNTADVSWCEAFPAAYTPFTETGTSFTLPAGVSAGVHTYRVSVTAGGYTLSKDIQITVTKAPGTLENKDYPTQFTYGDTVPTPKAENFTTNNPDGTFSYHWKTGNNSGLEPGANPVDAGTYILYATWTGGTNYTTASLSLAVTIHKAAQTANIAVVNETISGKGDGGVTLLPSAEGYESRKKGETTFESIPASQGQTFKTLAPGVTYEIRLAETKNYLPSAAQEVTVQPGRKLEVILPENQKGYTLTASKTQLDWHEDVTLTFQLDSVGAYKAADFGIWAEAGSEKTKLTLGNDGAVTLTAPEKDITITVTGVKTDNVAPQASIRGRLRKDSGYYVKWEGFQENPADDYVNGDFVISATDRLSGVADFWYYLSDKPLTLEELKGMNGAFWARPANQGKVSITEDGVYYLYAKALDKANNAGYACTGKLVKESNPPTFSGVENGKTYYVSQQMEIHDDGMPDWYMAEGSIGEVPNGGNENPVKLQLPNNGSSYTFTVGDRCGNEATITVYMKPLSDLTQPLDRIQEETIRKSDRATLDDVEATLKGLDVTYATEGEKEEINRALARIAQLRQVLDQVAAVEAQIDALPDSVEPYQQTVEDTQIKPARQAYSDLTDHQKTLVDSTKLDKLVRLEAQLNAWTITEGDGQTWYKGSGKPLSFTVNGQSRRVIGVRLENGNMLGKAMLTVSDSMDAPFTIALKPEYLQCREPGEHSFAVIYRGGTTEDVTFTVEIPANYLDVTGKPEFDGKTTVTVDGKEYPIEEMNGTRYVNLPETGDLLTIYSFKDGTPAGSYTNYPTGMQVFRITRQEGGAKAEEITEFANLLNYAGCSIRLTGTKGIRMITGIGEDARTALTGARGLGGYTLEEYGTVVMRGVGTPTLENSNSHNFAYKKGKADPVFARVGGMIQYTNVLVGFSLEDCKDTLTLRPYIKLKDMTTGETVTLYGGCVSRSIGYIAKQNENTYKPGTAGYKYIHEIIDAVYGKTEQGGETK